MSLIQYNKQLILSVLRDLLINTVALVQNAVLEKRVMVEPDKAVTACQERSVLTFVKSVVMELSLIRVTHNAPVVHPDSFLIL